MNADGIKAQRLLSQGERFSPRASVLARLIAPGFQTILDRVDAGLERGSLFAQLPDGTTRLLGGRAPGFEVEVELKQWRALVRLATNGSIGWYQAYEAGEWATDDKVALFALFSDNVRALGNTARPSGPFKWAVRLAHWLNRNDRRGAARNITAHYDLGNDFYRAWLDPSMTYSSALELSDEDLSAGQQRKLRSIAARLGDAERVLEIGCGWGSLAQLLVQRGAEVAAISLSEEQLIWARRNCSPEIDFCQSDYRDITGVYDAVACVEMVEALGRENWDGFLQCVNRRLRPGGRAALQYISMADDLFEAYAGTVDFIQACIFPGGLVIKSSEFRELAERRGFAWRDHASFGHDYAETLRIWRQRFSEACSEGLLPPGFDERFVALWDYYLAYCEGGFRAGNINVHQVTLVKT